MYVKNTKNKIITNPVIIPPLENVTKPRYVMFKTRIKFIKNNSLLLEAKISLEKNINIPKPNAVATWLGPKPPEVSALEPVLTTISRRSGVYKIKYIVQETMGNPISNSKLFISSNVIFLL